jgi:hypothetical protein
MIDRNQVLGRADEYNRALAGLAREADWEPTFVFRLGHPTARPPHSPRRPLAQVIRS